jgi:hypothetical protein
MESFKAVALGILGFVSCLSLLLVAGRLTVRWHRVVICLVAMQGLFVQGALWRGITCTLKRFDVGGSYFWLHAALVTSVVGMVWALIVLGVTFYSRRPSD